MPSFDTLHTADYSPLVVHFTKDRQMVQHEIIRDGDPLFPYKGAPARQRLVNILTERTIHASPMPWLPTRHDAVCFSECIWESLNQLADRYSRYGIVFSKRLIFDNGGGPALYIRGDVLGATGNQIPAQIQPFIEPFDPEATLRAGVRNDWLHEREWRLPNSLTFIDADIKYVIVDSILDATELVRQIGALRLPESKIIPMEVYRNIKEAWSDQ